MIVLHMIISAVCALFLLSGLIGCFRYTPDPERTVNTLVVGIVDALVEGILCR